MFSVIADTCVWPFLHPSSLAPDSVQSMCSSFLSHCTTHSHFPSGLFLSPHPLVMRYSLQAVKTLLLISCLRYVTRLTQDQGL